VSLANSIVANSLGGGDCTNSSSTVTADSATIIEDNTCGAQRSGDPRLLPLANNGGATKTHALKSNSIAQNTGDFGTCEVEDQRGQLRNDGDSTCDVGAIEYNPNDDSSFFVIPLGSGKVVIFGL
jgi:hypothetical protein